MILVIDNYDSFTFNLVQYFLELGHSIQVKRNDQVGLAEIDEMRPRFIVLSPGPGCPDESGICPQIVEHFKGRIPILGVCLGHQVIAQAFGATIKQAIAPMHGKTSLITHDNLSLFRNLPSPITIARYHSLIVSEDNLPSELMITAKTDDGEIMGIRHQIYPIEGIQFHPESILSEYGKELLNNFVTAN